MWNVRYELKSICVKIVIGGYYMKHLKSIISILLVLTLCGCQTEQNKSITSNQGNETITETIKNTEDSNELPALDVLIKPEIRDSYTFSCGWRHVAAVSTTGDLYVWGSNEYGQIGDGQGDGENDYNGIGYGIDFDAGIDYASTNPYKVLSDVKMVSLGSENSAAVTNNGDLYTWGDQSYGSLGNGIDNYFCSVPTKIMNNISYVSCSGDNTAAITSDGELYMWGKNENRILGNEYDDYSNKPVKIMDNIKQVAVSPTYHYAAITTNGELYMWGNNEYGQLGISTYAKQPKKVMNNVSRVELGYYSTIILTESGELYTCGAFDSECLGRPELGETFSDTPTKILDNVVDFDCGYTHAGAVTADGELYVWGMQRYGALGRNFQNAPYDAPYKLKLDIGKIIAIEVGRWNTVVLNENGELFICGRNEIAQIGLQFEEEVYDYIKIMDNIATTASITSEIETDVDDNSENVKTGKETDSYNFIRFTFQEAEVGDVVPFGNYSWHILSINDNNIKLLCKDTIGKEEYNKEYKFVTWEECSLRNWLNNDFYNSFSEEEQSYIVKTKLKNDDNSEYGTDGGNDTEDYIYLLDIDEAEMLSKDIRNIGCVWWLRSPGSNLTHAAAIVNRDGELDTEGYFMLAAGGVRPVLNLEF